MLLPFMSGLKLEGIMLGTDAMKDDATRIVEYTRKNEALFRRQDVRQGHRDGESRFFGRI